MKTVSISLLVCFVLGAALAAGQPPFPKGDIPSEKAVYHLIRGATVHASPSVRKQADILVHKGRIVEVGAEIQTPENTVVHDYPGMHVFPSFVELDSRYGLDKAPDTGRSSRRRTGPHPDRSTDVAMYHNEAFHPETDAIDGFSPDTAQASALRAKGVGVVLTHHHDGLARGSSALVNTGTGSANDVVLKSRAAMHYSFDKGSSKQDYPKSLMGAVALLRQAFYDVEWYANSSVEEVDFSLEAAVEKRHLPEVFHAGRTYDLYRIQTLAEEFGKDFVVVGTGEEYRVLQSLENPPRAIVAPLKFPDPYDLDNPGTLRFVSQTDLMHWEFAPFNPSFVLQSGVPLVLSTEGLKDAKAVFEALRKTVGSGLHPDSALAALTTVPARLLGVGESLGRIDNDYAANFFVTTADPRVDEGAEMISHWIAGRPYFLSNRVEAVLKGKYGLNLDGFYPTLTVEGNQGLKARVEGYRDGDTTSVEAVLAVRGNEISLTFKNPKGEGYYRLGATMLTGYRIWDGFGTDPEGKRIAWTAIKQRDERQSLPKDTSKTEISTPPTLITPLVAYGYDTLPQARTLLIKNATLWTNDDQGTIGRGSLLISDGKIVAVGPTVDPLEHLPKGKNASYSVWDAKGKHITPGLIDEHSHIAIEGGVNEGSDASTAEVRIGDVINPADINIFRQLAGGVTTSQLLHGSANPIGGQSAIVKLRWGASAEDMLFEAAPPFIKFALGENVKQSNWGDLHNERYPQTRMGVEQFFYESFIRAREYGEMKKLAEARQRPSSRRKKKTDEKRASEFRRDLRKEALLEILQGERHITCHSYVQSEMAMLLHVADSLGFKLNTFTHGLEAYKLGDEILRRDVAVSTFSDWWAYKYEVIDAIPQNASILNQLGVLTAINSDDAEMGRRLNQEAAKSLLYGNMSEEDALKLVTLNPAIMMHIDEFVGSLTPGKHADFVVWSDHPLSSKAVAEKTFIDGKLYFDRSVLNRLMERDRLTRKRIADKMSEAKKKGSKTRTPERKTTPRYHCDSL